jgi:hypothetical protein
MRWLSQIALPPMCLGDSCSTLVFAAVGSRVGRPSMQRKRRAHRDTCRSTATEGAAPGTRSGVTPMVAIRSASASPTSRTLAGAHRAAPLSGGRPTGLVPTRATSPLLRQRRAQQAPSPARPASPPTGATSATRTARSARRGMHGLTTSNRRRRSARRPCATTATPWGCTRIRGGQRLWGACIARRGDTIHELPQFPADR